MIDKRAALKHRKELARRAKRRGIRAVRRTLYGSQGPMHRADHTKAVR